jgi:lipopolysaccharide transport system ATP-binding protein
MSDDVLVKVDNVSKRFCRSLKRSLWYGLQDLGSEIGGRRHGGGSGLPQSSADVQLRPNEFWAVKDVSFELRRGECLGLIGRNGAGKTTLLRMLNGLIKPDTGRIEMKGNVNALIALGAGFNPILSGRENIYTNASVLGLSSTQIRQKLEEIVDFSEIEEFVDSPVQTYSSGMQVRLGFAIATALNPDILILDEVLAVGDAKFRAKCWKKLGDILSSCCAILVSHESYAISRICDVAMLLEKGSSSGLEETHSALSRYEVSQQEKTQEADCVHSHSSDIDSYIIDVPAPLIAQGGDLEIVLEAIAARELSMDHIMINVESGSGMVVAQGLPPAKILDKGENRLSLRINNLMLPAGDYSVVILVSSNGGKKPILHSRLEASFTVQGHVSYGPTYYPCSSIKRLPKAATQASYPDELSPNISIN